MAVPDRGGAPMTDEALWALGRGTGITALVFLTLALSLGIATRSGRPMLSLPRFAVADVHRFAALAGTALVLIHVLTLLADPYAQLRLVDSVVPFLGTYRPLWQGLGTLGFDVLAAVIVTSILRHRIGCAPSASCTGRPMHFGRSPSPMLSATGQASPNGGSCWSPGFAW